MIIHKTKRMAIWVFDYCPDKKTNAGRTMFVGVPRDEDWPFAAVVASVLETQMFGGTAYLDMIQTNPIMGRKGYATDMVDFLAEQFGGPLGASGVTDDGDAFVAAMVEAGKLAPEPEPEPAE